MLNVGQMVEGRYMVQSLLGHGGMAHVYQARDVHLGREVALKVLRPALTDSDQDRFRREIQTLAQLNHPNVVCIYDLGSSLGNSLGSSIENDVGSSPTGNTIKATDQTMNIDQTMDGVVYFVMELVDAGPITALGPFEANVEPAITLFDAGIAVAQALAYVHNKGIIHRDLTPHNILRNRSGTVKVMDFGLVHLTEGTRLTRTGLTLGTPYYMAPEQAAGGDIAANVDLYALGAVLYHLLTGSPPFTADSDQAVLYKHVYETPQPAHERNPQIPVMLSQLVGQLLAKDPTERLHSAEQVALQLAHIKTEWCKRSSEIPGGGVGRCGVLGGVGRKSVECKVSAATPYAATYDVAGSLGGGVTNGVAVPEKLVPTWHLKLGKGMQWPAALTSADGLVVAGTRGDTLYMLHPASGAILAEYPASDEINTPISYIPQAKGGILSYVSRSGAVVAVDYPSATLRWRDGNARAVGTLVVGRVLYVSTDDGIVAREVASGEQQWHCNLEAPSMTSPILSGDALVVMTQSGWLQAVHWRTGKPLFKVEVGICRAQPSARGSLLLIPEQAGDIHAFDLSTMTVRWSYDTEGELWTTPLLWGGGCYSASWSGVVRAIELATGDDQWQADVGARVTATPVLASGFLYVVTEKGMLWVLDATDGTVCYTHAIGSSPAQASPLVLGGRVFASTVDGTLQAYQIIQ